MTAPPVGTWLYASCSDAYYGQIARVGEDANGIAVLDIVVEDPNDLIAGDRNMSEEDAEWPDYYGLTAIVLPPGVKALVTDVQWKDRGDGYIVCNTPGGGCYRCTKLFKLHAEQDKSVVRRNLHTGPP